MKSLLDELRHRYLGVTAEQVPDDEVEQMIRSVPAHYSANTLVDLGNTTQAFASIVSNPLLSGSMVAPSSGPIIGQGGFMGNADTYCNLFVAGMVESGQLKIAVQCANSDVSGQYTDPTSGLAAMPGAFSSGGVLIINSGGVLGGTLGTFVSGQAVASGFFAAQGFNRTGPFVRAVALSGGLAAGGLTIGFISQLRTTGSGGGTTMAPSSGAVSV